MADFINALVYLAIGVAMGVTAVHHQWGAFAPLAVVMGIKLFLPPVADYFNHGGDWG